MERTLMIIKPDGVKKNAIGAILQRVENAGLTIKCIKMLQLDRNAAKGFYAVHRERPFFQSLVEYMTSGPVVVGALEGLNAVNRWRDLIGATDPKKADKGTIRNLYGDNIERNVVHGSDSTENGMIETAYFFSTSELEMTSA